MRTTEKTATRGAAANRRLAQWRVQCLIEVLCFVSSSVMVDSLVLRIPLLRQSPPVLRHSKKMKIIKMRVCHLIK